METSAPVMARGFGGMVLPVDVADLPFGTAADLCNVETERPNGALRPRPGSRSLPRHDSSPNAGHPSNPIGNSNFNGSARVLRLIADDHGRRLFAVAAQQTDKVGVYHADLTQTAPGFTLAAGNLNCKTSGIPGAAVYKDGIFIATGLTTDFSNIYGAVGQAGQSWGVAPLPPQFRPKFFEPEDATHGEQPAFAAGDLSASIGRSYVYCYKNPTTLERTGISALSQWWKLTAPGGPRAPIDGSPYFNAKRVRLWLRTPPQATINAGYTVIEIYRTTDGGDQLRFLAEFDWRSYWAYSGLDSGWPTTYDVPPYGHDPAVVYGNNRPADTIFTYLDNIQDDQLGQLQPPTATDRIPTCKFVVVHLDRLIYAHQTQAPADPSILYYTDPLKPTQFAANRNSITVWSQDGDEITGLLKLYNRAFVLKRNQMYELSDNRPISPFRIDPIMNEGGIGCVAHATIAEVEGYAFWLSYAGVVRFDGQGFQVVSGPLADILTERQLGDWRTAGTALTAETGRSFIAFTHRNTAATSASPLHFHLRFYAAAADPDVATPLAEIETKTILADRAKVRVNGVGLDQVPSAVFSLAAAQLAHVQAYPSGLQTGQPYTVYVRDHNGTTWGTWRTLPSWTPDPLHGGISAINWGLCERFFAVDHWPTREYWLYVASEGSNEIDTKLVLAIDSLAEEGGPRWRRETIDASAATLVARITPAAERPDIAAVVFGDRNGCVWVDRWPDVIDRQVVRATALGYGERVGSCTLNAGRTTLTDIAKAWPTGSPSPLRGNAVVVRDPTGTVYTGIVTANAASTLTIGLWLEGRMPPASVTCEYALGGIDAHCDLQLCGFDDPQVAKELRTVLIEANGSAQRMQVELRAAEHGERFSDAGLARTRRSLKSLLIGGGVIARLPLAGRARFFGLRFGTIAPGADWEVGGVGLHFSGGGPR